MALLSPSVEELASMFRAEHFLAGKTLPYCSVEANRQHITGLLVRYSNAELVEIVRLHPGLCAPLLLVKLLELADDARMVATKHDVFLCDCMYLGLGGDPETELNRMKREGKLFARVCNTVWGKFSIAYRCQTCGLSSASSLCVDCFKAGDHEGHDYSIYKSSFGGCCDCGNPEAWATAGNCAQHRGHDPMENPMEVLESDPFMGEGKSFSVMLHTVTLLTLRSIVKGAMAVGLEDPEEPWDHLLGSFAEVSVPWLEKLSGMGDSIRRQAGRELIQVWLSGPVPDLIRMPPPQEDEPLCQAIARVRATSAEADGKKIDARKKFSLLHGLGAIYSTTMCDQLINLYLQLLYDTEFKYKFMNIFLHFYPTLAEHMLTLTEDKPKREMDDFINRVTAQLWNIHDSIDELSKNEMDLVGILMDTLFSVLVKAVPEGKTHVSCVSIVTSNDLYWSFVTDLTTVIAYEPIYQHVMRHRKDLVQTWLEIMALCVDVSAIKRERFAHVQYEQNEWRVAFALEISLTRSFQPFFSGFSKLIEELGIEHGVGSGKQLATVRHRVGLVVSQLYDMFTSLSMEQDVVSKVQPSGEEVLMTKYDIQLRPVTMHIALHRILAGFMLQAIEITDLETIISKESLPPHFLDFLLEHPLRIHALHGQVQAGLWVRNGNSLLSQVVLYRKNQCCYDDGFDYDVSLMQMTAILIGADHFVTVAQDRFGFVKSIDVELEAMATKDRTTLMFEFLAFLIHICSHVSRSCLSDEEQIEREIVHRLVWEDQTFSKVSSTICQRLTNHVMFEKLLNKVATHQSANDFEEGRYKLRPEYWAHFDQYYPRFFPRERQLAQDRYRSFMAARNQLKEKGSIPRPKLSPIKPQLRRILLVLSCRSTMHIVHAVLNERVRRNPGLAENIVNAALHLVFLGLERAETREASHTEDVSPGQFHEEWFDGNLRLPLGPRGESILHLLAALYHQCDETVQPFIRSLLLRAASRSPVSTQLIASLTPDLLDGSGDEKMEDENELRKSQTRERNRRRQEAIMNQFKAAQSNFLRTTSDNVLGDAEEDEENGTALTCVLCRDSCSLEQLNSSQRVIGHMGLAQRTRLLSVAHQQESGSKDRLGLMSVSINEANEPKKAEETEEAAAAPVERGQEVPCDVSMGSPGDSGDEEMEQKEQKEESAAEVSPSLEELLCDPDSEESKDIRFCGHHVHSDCLFRYFATLCAKHEARQDFEGRRIVALPDGEFLCPFCRRLCNCLVPAVANFPRKYSASAMACEETLLQPPPPITVEQWLPCLGRKVAAPCEAQVAALHLSSDDAADTRDGGSGGSSGDGSGESNSATVGGGGEAGEAAGAGESAALVPPSSPVPPPPAEGAPPQAALRRNLEMLVVRLATVAEPLYPMQALRRLDAPRICHLLWEVVAERIAALEQRARHSEEPFFFYLDRHEAEVAQNSLLVAACEAYQELSPRASDYAARGHERLVELVLARRGSLLRRRLASVLVACVLAGEAVVSEALFCGLVRFLTAAHLLQVVASLLAEAAGVAPQPAAALVVLQRLAAGEELLHEGEAMAALVQARAAPFLRQAAILYATVAAQAGVADCLDAVSMADTEDDHHALCAFLQLPRNLLEVLSPDVLRLAHGWVGGGPCLSSVFEPVPFSFTPLPNLFQEAYQHLATQVCRVCNDVTVEPGVCLLCGAFVCGGTKHLDLPHFNLKSSLNSFVQHTQTCCAGIGVFLMLKLCTVLLFRGKRISVWNSIYLDDHGEEDLELRRGKALFLNKSRQRQLLALVLSQAVDHDTRVLDKTKQLVRV